MNVVTGCLFELSEPTIQNAGFINTNKLFDGKGLFLMTDLKLHY